MNEETLLTGDAQPNTADAAGEKTVDSTKTESDAKTTTEVTPPAKTDDAAKVEEVAKTTDKAEAKAEQPAGAPEKYEAFTMPEGFALDEQLFNEFAPVLKELNLPQAAAQKVMDFAPKLIEHTQQSTIAQVLEQTGLKDFPTWAGAVKTDKELGGDKYAENLAVAKKAIDTFGTPELRAILKQTGLGNHPELVRAFYRAGKQISEDTFVSGSKVAPKKSTAEVLYPSHSK
jgi:hypothetical protein